MGHAHATRYTIENPGKLQGAKTLPVVFGLFVVVGLISFFALLGSNHQHAWSALLRAHFYFLTVSLGAMFFVVIQWITTSMWSAPVRRLAEGFTAYIPFIIISTLLIFLGSKSLFMWTNLDAIKGDAVIEGKLGYLNMTFFSIRTLVAAVGWAVCRL